MGYLRTQSFLEVLWRSGATSRERFYDLGSGTGKLAAIAWLTGMRATGIELSRARSEIAWQMQARLESRFSEASKSTETCSFPKIRTGGLKYVCGSIFDVDFTDADVVFFSSRSRILQFQKKEKRKEERKNQRDERYQRDPRRRRFCMALLSLL